MQSSQIQMPNHQRRNTINSSQDNLSPLEPSNPITVGPKKCNTAKAQDENFKIVIYEYDLKENMNKSIKEIDESTNSGMK